MSNDLRQLSHDQVKAMEYSCYEGCFGNLVSVEISREICPHKTHWEFKT
jgi:hypothetical protein